MTVPGGSALNYTPGSQPPPKRVALNRAPTTSDSKNFREGDEWLDKSSSDWYKLADVTGQTATWVRIGGTGGPVESFIPDEGTSPVVPDASNQITMTGSNGLKVTGGLNSLTFEPHSGGFPITPYVVGPLGQAGYQTIQSAIDAANTAGGGMVFVQFGTYTEDLTFYDNIQLVGDSEQGTFITGIHTPPASGTLNINRCTFNSATHIFSSAAAGSTVIIVEDCTVNCTNGYTFNLPNWTGAMVGFDLGESGATNDGWVNNTGGGVVFMTNITMGKGTVNTMITSGSVELYNCVGACPIDFQTGSEVNISGGSYFNETVTFSNNSTGVIVNSAFSSGATPCITYNSSENSQFSTCSFTTTNDPCFSGTGSGTIDVTGCSFISNSNFAATLTVSGGTLTSGSFNTIDQADGLTITSDTISADGTSANIDITMTPKGTGTVNPSALSVNSAYTFPATDGTSSQVLATNGAGVLSFVDNSSTASGTVIQSLSDTTNTELTAASVFVIGGNSIPLITAGSQIFSVTITPTSATSILRIEGGVPLSCNVNDIGMVAIFRDGGANAIYTTGVDVSASNMVSCYYNFNIVSGSVAATTFTVRFAAASGTAFVNRINAGSRYGGTSFATIRVTEYSS